MKTKYGFKLYEVTLPKLKAGDDVTIRGGVWHGYTAKFVRRAGGMAVVELPSRPEVEVPSVARSRAQAAKVLGVKG
jgi:hypothetical protein